MRWGENLMNYDFLAYMIAFVALAVVTAMHIRIRDMEEAYYE